VNAEISGGIPRRRWPVPRTLSLDAPRKQRAGLAVVVEEHVRISRPFGVNVHVKVPGIVAGRTGGTDGIDDLDLLGHGAMPALSGGIGHLAL